MKKLSRNEMKNVMGGYIPISEYGCTFRCTGMGGDPIVIAVPDCTPETLSVIAMGCRTTNPDGRCYCPQGGGF